MEGYKKENVFELINIFTISNKNATTFFDVTPSCCHRVMQNDCRYTEVSKNAAIKQNMHTRVTKNIEGSFHKPFRMSKNGLDIRDQRLRLLLEKVS